VWSSGCGASGGRKAPSRRCLPLELVGKPLEGVRDANTQGAEALAVAWQDQSRNRSRRSV